MKPKDEQTQREDAQGPAPGTDPRAGIASEVGDFDDPDAEDEDDALPGRAGGGLAGG